MVLTRFFSSHLQTCLHQTLAQIQGTALPAAPDQQQNASLTVSALWDDAWNSVFYVDVFASGTQRAIYRYDFSSDKLYSASLGQEAGPTFLIPKPNKDGFVAGVGKSVYNIQWDGISDTATVEDAIFSIEQNDPLDFVGPARQGVNGVLYGTTFHPQFCGAPNNATTFLYNGNLQNQFSDFKLIDTVAFSQDGNTAYYTDSCRREVVTYSVDSASGSLDVGKSFPIIFIKIQINCRSFFSFPHSCDHILSI